MAAKFAVLLIILILMPAARTQAASVIEADERKNVLLTVSRNDINRIEMPEAIVEGLSSKDIDVKIRGRNLFVKVPDSNPAELFIRTEKRTISLTLIPKNVPSETILIIDGQRRGGEVEGISGAATSYEKEIKTIILGLAKEAAPPGYSETRPRKGKPSEIILKNGISVKEVYALQGPFFEGNKYQITNTDKSTLTLSEDIFSELGTAVSLDKLELQPGESGRLFIVSVREESDGN